MLRQEAWADLRNERWSLFTFFALGTPVRRCISYLVVSSLSLSLPKAAGPGSEDTDLFSQTHLFPPVPTAPTLLLNHQVSKKTPNRRGSFKRPNVGRTTSKKHSQPFLNPESPRPIWAALWGQHCDGWAQTDCQVFRNSARQMLNVAII